MGLEDFKLTSNDSSQSPKGISLSKLLDVVSTRVESIPTAWVVAEIANVKDSKHLYIELVEHNDDGVEVAKCRAAIWASKKNSILTQFKNGTGGNIKPGIKVLISGKLSFHASYGLTFLIDAIDPSYTLGDMQRKLIEIRERLAREGVIYQNKGIRIPTEFTRVAVIAPEDAAGLGDFKASAEWLEKYNLCAFEYFTATFQGNTVGSSICTAIHNVHNRHIALAFDAVVIIRGGGAATDLAQLNEYQIAKSVCISALPVFTGIGHERDNTILDEVANTKFDTPSKVIAHIMDSIVNNARNADRHWQSIWSSWVNTKNSYEANINNQLMMIEDTAKSIIATQKQSLDMHMQISSQNAKRIMSSVPIVTESLMMDIKAEAKNVALVIGAELENNLDSIKSSTKSSLIMQKASLETEATALKQSVNMALNAVKTDIKNFMEYITGMGPRQTLKRGYAIVRSEGEIVTSVQNLKHSNNIEIEFHDGKQSLKNIGEN